MSDLCWLGADSIAAMWNSTNGVWIAQWWTITQPIRDQTDRHPRGKCMLLSCVSNSQLHINRKCFNLFYKGSTWQKQPKQARPASSEHGLLWWATKWERWLAEKQEEFSILPYALSTFFSSQVLIRFKKLILLRLWSIYLREKPLQCSFIYSHFHLAGIDSSQFAQQRSRTPPTNTTNRLSG